MRLLVTFTAIITLGSACKNGAAPAAERPLGTDPVLAAHMTEHFLHIVRIRDAVSGGNYQATRTPARWLAEKGATSNVPHEWGPMVSKLREASAAVVEAGNLSEVAGAFGPVVHSCGDCHRQLVVTVELPGGVKAAAPVGDGFEQRMARHDWALKQMWFGLIAPNDDAWLSGATAVASDTLHPPKGPAMPSDAKELEAIADSLKELGGRAAAANTGQERAALYSDMLLKCVACHDQARR